MMKLWARNVAVLALLCACTSSTPAGPAPTTPTQGSAFEGTGETVAGRLGPAGARFVHSDSGAELLIPGGAVEGAMDAAFRMAPSADGALEASAGLQPVGPVMTFAPPLETPAARPMVLSIPLASASVPEGFDVRELKLAIEKTGNVGAADGEGTAATQWDYMDAEHAEERASAQLRQVAGMRMQFVFRKAAQVH